jgi:hypothetical protein
MQTKHTKITLSLIVLFFIFSSISYAATTLFGVEYKRMLHECPEFAEADKHLNETWKVLAQVSNPQNLQKYKDNQLYWTNTDRHERVVNMLELGVMEEGPFHIPVAALKNNKVDKDLAYALVTKERALWLDEIVRQEKDPAYLPTFSGLLYWGRSTAGVYLAFKPDGWWTEMILCYAWIDIPAAQQAKIILDESNDKPTFVTVRGLLNGLTGFEWYEDTADVSSFSVESDAELKQNSKSTVIAQKGNIVIEESLKALTGNKAETAISEATSVEVGYVRLAIKGTKVNLRPEPRAAGIVIAQMNTGDVFIAEKWPITLKDDESQWYKIVLPAPDSGKIEPLCDWDERFISNVAYVNANFVAISPLEKSDMERILATPVGIGYSYDAAHGINKFDAMVKAGLIPFSSSYFVKERAEIFGGNPLNSKAPVVGHYERGEIIVTGMEPEGKYYMVMDPKFRKPAGFIKAANISVKPVEIESWQNNFNWGGFDSTCQLSLGANLPEIVRKWGEAKIERSAFDFLDGYVIYTSVETPDFVAAFYETLPEPDGTVRSLTIPYLQQFYTKRKGAMIGGIHIGHSDEDAVKKLLGEPHSKDRDRDSGENFWNWNAEFNDLWIYFDENGLVSSISIQWRAAD